MTQQEQMAGFGAVEGSKAAELAPAWIGKGKTLLARAMRLWRRSSQDKVHTTAALWHRQHEESQQWIGDGEGTCRCSTQARQIVSSGKEAL